MKNQPNFLHIIQERQNKEIAEDEQNDENAHKLLNNYAQELGANPRPVVSRMHQMLRNIAGLSATYKGELAGLSERKPTSPHAIELPPNYRQKTYSQYAEWRKVGIEDVIGKCKNIRKQIETQLKYPVQAPSTPRPAPAVDRKQSIFFDPEIREKLYNALALFVDERQHPTLQAFIGGSLPSEQITVHCQQNEFGAAFYRSGAVKRGHAKALSDQLPHYFNLYKKGEIANFSPSTLEKHLRGIDLPKL